MDKLKWVTGLDHTLFSNQFSYYEEILKELLRAVNFNFKELWKDQLHGKLAFSYRFCSDGVELSIIGESVVSSRLQQTEKLAYSIFNMPIEHRYLCVVLDNYKENFKENVMPQLIAERPETDEQIYNRIFNS
jgi:hypothetical protein